MADPHLSAKDRLLHLLFGRTGVRTENVMFMRGDKPDVTEEEFCDAVAGSHVRRRAGLLKREPLPKSGTKINVKSFVDAL